MRRPECKPWFAAAMAALITVGALPAVSPWSPSTPIVANLPLEMGQPLPGVDVGGLKIPVAILFAAAPKLQVGLIDPTGAGSVSFTTIDSAGTNFALGTVGEIDSGQIGGSYVTSAFDLRFWTCSPPCNSASTFPIETVQTWIDSSSAAAGVDFVVGGLNNTTGAYHLFSSTNGSSWTPLRTLSPAGGIYRNFDGGERVALAVDANASQATNALNCVFYEVPTRGPATEKRIDCANGATPLANVLVSTDIEDPLGQAGPLIENRFYMIGGMVWGVFTRRQDNMLYAVSYLPGGAPVVIPLGPAPTGNEFFGLTLAGPFTYFPTHHVSLHAETGLRLDFLVDDDPVQVSGSGPGPSPGLEGPIALAPAPPGCLDVACTDLYAVNATFWFDLAEGAVSGLGLAKKALPAFEDGFETNDTDRWSSTVP